MIKIIAPIQQLNEAKQTIEGFINHIPDIVNDGAVKAQDLVQDRVEGQGLATNGSYLETPSQNPIGRYGQRHGKAREKKGLQTSIVSLRFEGQMWDSWDSKQMGEETGVGFNNEEANYKAEANEDLYGTEIFEPSELEIEVATRFMQDKIEEYFK